MGNTTNKFRKFTAITTALAMVATSNAALALPTGGTVATGTATIANTVNTTTINQSSHGAFINWATFGSNAGETITFNQPTSTSYTVNRVTTPNVPSVLAGAMNANGQVVVMNNAGITFAQGSQVNVGALAATTASNISFDSTGNIASFSGISNAPIVNNGTITTAAGGGVAIQAANITNNGTITMPGGTVALGATDGMTIDMSGNGKVLFQPGGNLAQSVITNNGTIETNTGNVTITNQAANAIAQSVINLNGVIDTSCFTNCAQNASGKLVAGNIQVASAGDIKANGDLYANGGPSSPATGDGGNITLNAAGDAYLSGNISANGGTTQGNGGTINVNATNNITSSGTNISANGYGTGNGGTITNIAGNDLTATGHTYQAFGGNNSGGTGIGGNITMQGNNFTLAGGELVGVGGTDHFIDGNNVTLANGAAGTLNTISAQWIGNQSTAGSNTIIDGPNITLADLNGGTIAGGDGSLTLRTLNSNGVLNSTGAINFVDGNDGFSFRSGNFTAIAGSGGINIGNITSTGDATHTSGQIDLTTYNGGNVTATNLVVSSPLISTVGGQLVVNSSGNVTVNGNIYLGADDYDASANGLPTVTGSIIAAGDVVLNGSVQVIAIDNYRPDIHPTATLYVAGNNITTNGQIYVNAAGYSSEGAVASNNNDVITADAQFIAKDSVIANKDIYVLATDQYCIFPVTANANVTITAANGNIDTSKANVVAQATTGTTASHANATTNVLAPKGNVSIAEVAAIADSTCCTGYTGRSTAVTTINAGQVINFDGIDPYSEANAQFYQGRVSGEQTNGNDLAQVIINQHPAVTPPVTCQDNCTPTNPVPLVNLPPSTIANLAPAAGGGGFCDNVNISTLPGLCYPEAPHVAELAPAAGVPIPFKFGPSVAPKKFAELAPKSGRCVNVTKPNGGKDTVCIKDEIDK